MSAEDQLIEFVTARLDEWEALAEAAGGEWGLAGNVSPRAERTLVTPAGRTEMASAAEALHAAEHDPASTLRLVASLRKLVELASQAGGLDMQVQAEFGVGQRGDDDPYIDDVMLRWAAAIWSAHPDYQEKWKP